jgi:hypothetical protein
MAATPRPPIDQVIDKWLESWTMAIENEADKQSFLSVYHPSITWTDHAFHVQRTGFEAILGLKKGWNYCNQPFRSEIKVAIAGSLIACLRKTAYDSPQALHPTQSGAVLEAIWHGRCVNDLVRPNGETVIKAHGKEFENHVCFVLEIDDEGLIRTINEYFNRIFEDGVGIEKYQKITGASMKSLGD